MTKAMPSIKRCYTGGSNAFAACRTSATERSLRLPERSTVTWPRGAASSGSEALENSTPWDEARALELAREALEEYVDAGLIYTRDILELWDGSTHDNVILSDGYDDIMGAITASPS